LREKGFLIGIDREGKNWYNINENDFYLGGKCGKI
jgi:hypothetical protein